MRLEAMNNVFPEYYVLRVNQFDATKEPTTPGEEWMRYLKTGYIDPNTKVPGLREAWERLKVLKMTVKELKQYKDYQFNRRFEENVINAARFVAEKKGLAEGKKESEKESALKMKAAGLDPALIAELTGVTNMD